MFKFTTMIKRLCFTLFFAAGVMLAQGNHQPTKLVAGVVLQNKTALDFSTTQSGQDLRLTIEGQVEKVFTVEIYSITGQRIANWDVQRQDGKNYDFTLDKPLRKGLYIVKVSSGDKIIAKKLQI